MQPIEQEPGTAPAVHVAQPVLLRPHPKLLTYYVLSSLVLGPFFFFALLPFYFKYRSLRYEVDEEGIAMRWGILFRREVSLTYARIQDIQLSSNFVERWLGLARIQLQTASGSASAEMTIEGVREVQAMRDFLYARTRGGKGGAADAAALPPQPALAGPGLAAEGTLDELALTLTEVAAELRALRLSMTGEARGRGRDV